MTVAEILPVAVALAVSVDDAVSLADLEAALLSVTLNDAIGDGV